MEKAKIINYVPYMCPHCGNEIFIPQCKAKAITIGEYQKKIRETLKQLKK